MTGRIHLQESGPLQAAAQMQRPGSRVALLDGWWLHLFTAGLLVIVAHFARGFPLAGFLHLDDTFQTGTGRASQAYGTALPNVAGGPVSQPGR